MGLIRDAFGWMLGIITQPIDKINVEELDTMRG